MSLLVAAQASFIIQLLHSTEELSTGFHKKWYLTSMPFWVFLLFEICFALFWGVVFFSQLLPSQEFFANVFLLLMFANGIQHIVWFGWSKKYNPGLVTSLFHLAWASYSLIIFV